MPNNKELYNKYQHHLSYFKKYLEEMPKEHTDLSLSDKDIPATLLRKNLVIKSMILALKCSVDFIKNDERCIRLLESDKIELMRLLFIYCFVGDARHDSFNMDYLEDILPNKLYGYVTSVNFLKSTSDVKERIILCLEQWGYIKDFAEKGCGYFAAMANGLLHKIFDTNFFSCLNTLTKEARDNEKIYEELFRRIVDNIKALDHKVDEFEDKFAVQDASTPALWLQSVYKNYYTKLGPVVAGIGEDTKESVAGKVGSKILVSETPKHTPGYAGESSGLSVKSSFSKSSLAGPKLDMSLDSSRGSKYIAELQESELKMIEENNKKTIDMPSKANTSVFHGELRLQTKELKKIPVDYKLSSGSEYGVDYSSRKHMQKPVKQQKFLKDIHGGNIDVCIKSIIEDYRRDNFISDVLAKKAGLFGVDCMQKLCCKDVNANVQDLRLAINKFMNYYVHITELLQDAAERFGVDVSGAAWDSARDTIIDNAIINYDGDNYEYFCLESVAGFLDKTRQEAAKKNYKKSYATSELLATKQEIAENSDLQKQEIAKNEFEVLISDFAKEHDLEPVLFVSFVQNEQDNAGIVANDIAWLYEDVDCVLNNFKQYKKRNEIDKLIGDFAADKNFDKDQFMLFIKNKNFNSGENIYDEIVTNDIVLLYDNERWLVEAFVAHQNVQMIDGVLCDFAKEHNFDDELFVSFAKKCKFEDATCLYDRIAANGRQELYGNSEYYEIYFGKYKRYMENGGVEAKDVDKITRKTIEKASLQMVGTLIDFFTSDESKKIRSKVVGVASNIIDGTKDLLGRYIDDSSSSSGAGIDSRKDLLGRYIDDSSASSGVGNVVNSTTPDEFYFKNTDFYSEFKNFFDSGIVKYSAHEGENSVVGTNCEDSISEVFLWKQIIEGMDFYGFGDNLKEYFGDTESNKVTYGFFCYGIKSIFSNIDVKDVINNPNKLCDAILKTMQKHSFCEQSDFSEVYDYIRKVLYNIVAGQENEGMQSICYIIATVGMMVYLQHIDKNKSFYCANGLMPFFCELDGMFGGIKDKKNVARLMGCLAGRCGNEGFMLSKEFIEDMYENSKDKSDFFNNVCEALQTTCNNTSGAEHLLDSIVPCIKNTQNFLRDDHLNILQYAKLPNLMQNILYKEDFSVVNDYMKAIANLIMLGEFLAPKEIVQEKNFTNRLADNSAIVATNTAFVFRNQSYELDSATALRVSELSHSM